jgi:CDP-glucose 4,6-dehydratase
VKIPAPVEIDPDYWRRRRVLVTGHTGFKGAWLSLWLQALGAHVTGLAPRPARRRSLHRLAGVGEDMRELALDMRDLRGTVEAVRESSPEVVFHLAGQPLVRRSLQDPAGTFEVNVMGTVNLLEAVRLAGREVRAVVVVTSDKCYENPGGRPRRFVESDRLGGADPYSSSKACAELVAASYRRSFFAREDAPRIATARAGNVIGGGDWGEDRLLPDSVRAVETGSPLLVRNPDAVRPWQHVLGPLEGYLLLAQALDLRTIAGSAFNFGPAAGDAQPVGWIVARLGELWEGRLRWRRDEATNPPEAEHQEIDSMRAERELGWSARGGLADALGLLVAWHRAELAGEDMREVSLEQIARHLRRPPSGPAARAASERHIS